MKSATAKDAEERKSWAAQEIRDGIHVVEDLVRPRGGRAHRRATSDGAMLQRPMSGSDTEIHDSILQCVSCGAK